MDYKKKPTGLEIGISVAIGAASFAVFVCLLRVFYMMCVSYNKRKQTGGGSVNNGSTKHLVGAEA